jgi:hypothetical protein
MECSNAVKCILSQKIRGCGKLSIEHWKGDQRGLIRQPINVLSSARVRVNIEQPPVFRRFADSLAPHQNLVRAETAAEPAGIKVIHVYSIAL